MVNNIESSSSDKLIIESENYLDLSYLNEIANGDEKFISEMIKVLATRIPKELSLLGKALSQSDYYVAANLAHKLKASYKLIGFKELELLLTIERESREKSPDNLTEYFTQLNIKTEVSLSKLMSQVA